MTRRHRTKARGTATMMAIMVIGLLAAILTAVAARAVAEQRRAAAGFEHVQAGRLLAAAAQSARQQIADAKTATGPVATPLGQATLTWSGDAANRSCDVSVTVGRTSRAVTLRFDGGRVNRVE